MADRDLVVALRITGNASGAVLAAKSVESSLATVRKQLVQLASTAAAAFGGRELLRAAEAYQTLTARIRLAAESQIEFERAQSAVFGISQRTRAQLEATGTLYTRIADATRRLGASQQEQFKFIEALNQALAINGSVGSETASTIQQLSQALGKGVLNGDEFNSVNENGQRIMRALGDALGKTTGELRAMSEAGQLTSDLVFRGLLSQSGKLAQEFSQLPETVSGAFTRLNNSFQKFIGETDKGVGATRALAGLINGLATNFDTLGTAAIATAAVLGSMFAGRVVGAVAAHSAELARNTAAHFANAAAARASAQQQVIAAEAVLANAQRQAALISGMQRLTFAQTTLIPATRAAEAAQLGLAAAGTRLTAVAGGLRGVLGLLGGPIGAITALLSLGAIAWISWGDEAGSAADKAKRKLEETADTARRVLQRLKDEDSFGSGDLGTLRNYAEQLKARIEQLKIEAPTSLNAQEFLVGARKELEEVNAAIVKLEASERNAASAGDALRKSLTQAASDGKKGAEDTIKAYDSLRQALVNAFQEAIDKARQLREESKQAAADLQQSVAQADEKAKKERPQAGGSIANLDPGRDPKLVNEVLPSLEGSIGAVRSSEGAVSALDVSMEKSQAATAAAAGNMALFAEKIDSAKAKLLELANSGREETLVLSGLAKEIAAVEAGPKEKEAAALDQQAGGQAQLLNELELKLDTLRQKAGDIPVSLDISAAEKALDQLATKIQNAVKGGTTPGTYGYDDQGAYFNLDNIPQRAGGGLIVGPGGPRDDKVLMWGSNREFVEPAAAVEHYGVAFMEAIRRKQLPRFADGGMIGAQRMESRISVPSLSVRSTPPQALQPINLHFPSGQSYPMQATPDIGQAIRDEFSRMALQRGRRR